MVISGTLSNPQDLAKFLGNAVVVNGKGFSVERRIYVVVGKRDRLMRVFSKHSGSLASLRVNSFEELVNNAFGVFVQAAEQGMADLKADLYDAFIKDKAEVEDLLKAFKGCRETTIVFFPTIHDAESFATPLGIPLHHSKRKKSERLEVERGLREGRITMVGTVKTLLQGINVGSAKRVIHVGIPRLVRDFVQREGRVGRDWRLNYAESMIVPMGFDPRLISGVQSLLAWSTLPPEATVFNPDSAYVLLYSGVVKVALGLPTTREEERMLERFQLNDREKALEKFNKLKFYEVEGSNVKVVLLEKGKPVDVDRVSFKDMIESYQPGSIDVGTRAVVEDVKRDEGGKGRGYRVIERPPEEVSLECVQSAIDEYEATLYGWGIKPDFSLDVELSKVLSKVDTDVYFDGEGFVEVNEVPSKVRWFVESRRRIKVGDKYDYAYKVIDLDCDVFPKRKGYRYYTYAYVHEFSDPSYLYEGFAFLVTSLRLLYGIRVDLLRSHTYGNVMKVWESEPIGVLAKMREGNFEISGKKLDFNTFSTFLQSVNVDDIFKTVFYSASTLAGGVDFERARKKALDIAAKLFGYANVLFKKVKVSVSPDVLILDYVTDAKGNRIYSLTYSEAPLGRAETLVFSDRNEFWKEVSNKIMEMEIEEVIISSNELSVKPRMNRRLAQLVKEVNVLEEVKRKYGYDVSPSDLSKEAREILNKLLNPDSNVSEVEKRKMFRERAKVLQGLWNLLKGEE